MASGTRSGLRSKDDESHSSRKSLGTREGMSNSRTRTANALGSKQLAKGASSGKSTSTPPSIRKSERLEKGTPFTTPITRKSDRLVKHSTPSPLKRSDKGKKHGLSSPSVSSHSVKSFNSVDAKKKKEKKEKSIKQLTTESGRGISMEKYDQESISLKRKRMDARSYKSLFKAQKRRNSGPVDSDDKLERRDTLPRIDSVGSGGRDSKLFGDMEDGGHKCDHGVMEESREELSEGASEAAAPLGSASGFKDISANISGYDVEGKFSFSSRKHDLSEETPDHLDGDDTSIPMMGCTIRAPLDDATKTPKDYPSAEILKIPELVASSNMQKSADSDTCSESIGHSGESKSMSSTRNIQSKVPETKVGKDICDLVLEGARSMSANLEKHDFVGDCVVCYKKRRLAYDSQEEELCSCSAAQKDSGDVEGASSSESIQRCDHVTESNEILSDIRTDNHGNVCVKCKQPGELLHCYGKRCRRCYHLFCLDPSLYDAPPGVWHCFYCTKKKTELGIYMVAKGVESIWDAREVVVSDTKETRRQKQYLVKYQGLAHVYNLWVPESQLLLENPSLVAKYNENNQKIVWNSEWMVPSRLLKRRPLISSGPQDKYGRMGTNGISDCQNEWLVKWCGLDYAHATWEVENASFLQSPRGQKLIREYGIRYEKAKKVVDKSTKGSFVKLQKLSAGGSTISDDCYLHNVNKLRELWYKNQNAVVFDEQERFANVIFFILSLSNDHQPFLIASTSEVLSQWEAEFMRLAPSVNVVVYKGNSDTRKSIRTLEFYEEEGGIMLQVLLSPIEVVIEDLHHLKWLKWEVLVIDECQRCRASPDLEQMKKLNTDMRLLLFSGPIKDTVAEYMSLLSLLGSPNEPDRAGSLKSDTIDNLVKLKELFFRFTAYSKFVEYLVPVEISNLQLEQYCATLLENATALRTNSKTDKVGALREILVTLHKCCDHPYIVDSSLQPSMIAGLTPDQALEVGIKASGKLQLLHEILSKIRNQRLRALVLFQSIVGSGGMSIGDVLDDFLRGKFGQNSYERIDACLSSSKKQAALNRFNNMGSEQFVFLLENRACQSSIKLSVDTVFIFDSEWNPANDLKALQRLSIHSQREQINVHRFYSSCTIEEKVMILGKQNLNLENNLQTIRYSTSLLKWGAPCLFSRLDEYHAGNSTNSAADISSGQKLLCDIVSELCDVQSGCLKENDKHDPIISKVFRSAGTYHTNCPLLGERKVQLTDVEEPHIFWKKLLEGKNPRWKFLFGPTPRSRKRVKYSQEPSRKSEIENDDNGRKRRKVVNSCFSAASVQLEQEEGQVAGSIGEASMAAVTNQSQSLPASVAFRSNKLNVKNATSSFSNRNRSGMACLHVKSPSDEPKSLHAFVRAEIVKLCEILNLSKEVKDMMDRFLEYVMENHHVSKEPASILQAFQMSLCWTAAKILKQKIDKKDSLELAKRILNFKCTEEEAGSVYLKLRLLKKTFLQHLGNVSGSIPDNFKSALEDITLRSANVGDPPSGSFNLQNVIAEVEERSSNQELAHEQEPKSELTGIDLEKRDKKIQKKCDKCMSKLHLKDEKEIQEFHKMWVEKRGILEADHRKELIFVRAIHRNSAMGMDKLKISDTEFAKKIAEHEHLKEVQLKELEAKLSAATEEERKKIANWLSEAKSCSNQCVIVNEVHMRGSESEDDIGFSKASTTITCKDTENDAFPSGLNIEGQGLERIVPTARATDAIPPNVPVTVADEGVGCSVPAETLPIVLNSDSEKESETGVVEASSIPRVEQPKEGCHSLQGIAIDITTSEKHINDEVQSTGQNNELPSGDSGSTRCETGHAHAVETSTFNISTYKEQNADEIPSTDRNNEMSLRVCGNGGSPKGPYAVGRSSSVDIYTSKEQTADGIPLTNQSNEMPPGVSGNAGSEMGHDNAEEMSTPVESSPENDREHIVTSAITRNQKDRLDGFSCDGVTGPELLSVDLTDSLQPDAVERFQNKESMNMQDEDAPVTGNQTTTVGIVRSAPFDAGTNSQCNCEEVIKNSEQLRQASEDIAPGSSQSLAAEAVYQGNSKGSNCLRNSVASPQLWEESMEVSHQPDSENTVHSAQDHNQFDLLAANRTDHEPNSELSAHSQNREAQSQVIQNAAELPNQAVSQSGPNLTNAEASRLQLYGAHRVASWNATLPLHAEPLQNELERIHKEMEQAIELHDSTKLQLKSDCEKEIEEMAAQIRNKYEAKLKDAETVFALKKTELELNQNKVLMNKILAEAFRSKCLDLKSSGISGMQQVVPSSFMQHLHQLSLRPAVRHSPVISQQTVNLSVQSTHRSSGNFSGLSARPLLINAITPTIVNARVGEVRAPAPHLQPFIPAPACMSSANMPSLPCNPNQQAPVTVPATSPILPSLPPKQALLTSSQYLRPNPLSPATLPPGNQLSESEGAVQPCPRNTSLSALELLRNVHSPLSGHAPDTLACAPCSGSNAGAVDRASDVFCLSDDDD